MTSLFTNITLPAFHRTWLSLPFVAILVPLASAFQSDETTAMVTTEARRHTLAAIGQQVEANTSEPQLVLGGGGNRPQYLARIVAQPDRSVLMAGKPTITGQNPFTTTTSKQRDQPKEIRLPFHPR